MKPNIGQTVYYLSSVETYRYVHRGRVESVSPEWGCHVTGRFITIAATEIYATEEEAREARFAYYEQEMTRAFNALKAAQEYAGQVAQWRERARGDLPTEANCPMAREEVAE